MSRDPIGCGCGEVFDGHPSGLRLDEVPRTEPYQVLRTEEEGGHQVRLQNRRDLRYILDPPSCLLDENRTARQEE